MPLLLATASRSLRLVKILLDVSGGEAAGHGDGRAPWLFSGLVTMVFYVSPLKWGDSTLSKWNFYGL